MFINLKNMVGKMDFDINDNESNVIDLNDKSLNEVFELFCLKIIERDSSNILVGFHQNGYFIIQNDDEVTFWDVRHHCSQNINNLGNLIVNFCIKNDIEVVLI